MKKSFNTLLALVIAFFFALPSTGHIALADAKVYDNIEDGEYEIIAKAIKKDSGEKSGAAPFINEVANLSINDGEIEFTITIPHNEFAKIEGLQIENVEPNVKEGEDAKYKTYKLARLKSKLNAQVQYEVPSLDMEHDVPFIFDLEGLDELPVIEDEEDPDIPEEPEDPEEDPDDETGDTDDDKENGSDDSENEDGDKAPALTPDEAYTIDFDVASSAAKGYFNSPATLLYKDGQKVIQMTGSGGDMIKLLSTDGVGVVWGERNNDGTFVMQFKVDDLAKEIAFGMAIDTGTDFGVMEHTVPLNFDVSTKEKVEADNYMLFEGPKEIKVKSGEEFVINSGDIVTLDGAESMQLIAPDVLPANVKATITSVKDQVQDQGDLEIAGGVYEFDFEGLELKENPEYTLVMGYDSDKYSKDDDDSIDIYYYDKDKKEWIAQDGTVKDGKVTVQTSHFSTYGVFAKKAEDPKGDPKEDPKDDPKEEPEDPAEDPKDDDKSGLIPDKAYQIGYVIKQEDGVQNSVADDFFVKPALLFEKDGKKYVQLTITNGDMVKELSNKYGDVLLVKENDDGSIIVQLRVNDDLSDMLLDMHIVVPAMPGFPGYDMKHEALLVFDEDDMQEVSVGDHLLAGTNNPENKNGPFVDRDDTPKKPEFGSNGDDDDRTPKNGNGKKTENPQTGDTSNVLLYSLLLVGSFIPLAINLRRRRLN